jgi:phosphoribosyl-AMP cyclohydrolase
MEIKWDERGLVPAIVQDAQSGAVLMLAYMTEEALRLTLETGEAHFGLAAATVAKGATSGNVQRVREVFVDCDADTILLKVDPAGPACHTGEYSCFYRSLTSNE